VSGCDRGGHRPLRRRAVRRRPRHRPRHRSGRGARLPRRHRGLEPVADRADGWRRDGLLYWLARRRARPIAAPTLHVPNERPVDARIFVGTGLFGLGWGLVGLCPGPAITALFGGNGSGRVFVAAMLAGIAAATLGGRPVR
jgi:hypothetical protein